MNVKYHAEAGEIEFCFKQSEARSMAFLMEDLFEEMAMRNETIPALEPHFFKDFADAQEDFSFSVTIECLKFAASFLREVWHCDEWRPDGTERFNVLNCLKILRLIKPEGVTLH